MLAVSCYGCCVECYNGATVAAVLALHCCCCWLSIHWLPYGNALIKEGLVVTYVLISSSSKGINTLSDFDPISL